MSILNQAHDFVIRDFVSIQNNYQYGPTGIDVLREASSPGAAIDSRERTHRRCFPGTRKQYIVDIINWARVAHDGYYLSMYWMRGPAGVGKSSIAQTCAEKLQSDGLLGAAFFFSVEKYDHPTHLFTTLAYQLAIVLPDYGTVLDGKIFRDKTLVNKTLSSQFRSLFIEPLQELEKKGRGVGKKAIFIDGLDECADKDSQVEIIEIIASSVRVRSTPFIWAIFSREDPHIFSTFASPYISSHCYSVYLPISRKADAEIELYLRGGFENILKRRNLLDMHPFWPTTEQIAILVDAAAGLFAHPATVLRFIDRYSYSSFKETLEAVLAIITKSGISKVSPFTELDRLYTLILQRVPEDVLLPMRLFLSYLAHVNFNGRHWRVGILCNSLGVSETVFQSICHHLQAVLTFQAHSQSALDKSIADLRAHPYSPNSFKPSSSLENWLFCAHGTVNFHHKSFYDFLIDPTRSHHFCVSTLAMREALLSCFARQQLHYASSYVIQDTKLVLASDPSLSSALLSWPHGSEYVNSFIQFQVFRNVSLYLSHDHPRFDQFWGSALLGSLQKLAELDYRKSLVAGLMQWQYLGWSNPLIIGHAGTAQVLPHTAFGRLHARDFETFDPLEFLEMVEKLAKAGVIRPYHPQLGSGCITSAIHFFSRRKSSMKCCGQYKLGHAEKSVIWYWEFEIEKRYFHEFRTVNFAEAMKVYKAEKFRLWDKAWVAPP